MTAPRQWIISGWHASTPGTGAVYVDGPTLAPGEAVTVTEVPQKRITHGRHCTCSACAREDWTNPHLLCGMHGSDCPALYQPLGGAGEAVTETHDQGAPMYTTDGRIVLKQGQPLLEVVASDENANETAGIVASMLNEHDRDEKLLESFAQAISDRAA